MVKRGKSVHAKGARSKKSCEGALVVVEENHGADDEDQTKKNESKAKAEGEACHEVLEAGDAGLGGVDGEPGGV
jgi:endonuclease IV